MLSQSTRYYIPQPSTWPIFGSFALLMMALGAAAWFNGAGSGKYLVFAGLAVLFYMLAGWFSTVARESETGKFNKQVDSSFRWGMGWFIFSEVMFFGAFFGALFYMRVISIPDLGQLESQQLIWPGSSRGAHRRSRHCRAVHADGRVGHSCAQYPILLTWARP